MRYLRTRPVLPSGISDAVASVGSFLAIAFLGAVALSIVDHAVTRYLQSSGAGRPNAELILKAAPCQLGYVDCYGNCIKRSCGRRPDPSSHEGWLRRRPTIGVAFANAFGNLKVRLCRLWYAGARGPTLPSVGESSSGEKL
jgi:hypothetical protein